MCVKNPCKVCNCRFTFGFGDRLGSMCSEFYNVCPRCYCGHITRYYDTTYVIFGKQTEQEPDWEQIRKEYESQNRG